MRKTDHGIAIAYAEMYGVAHKVISGVGTLQLSLCRSDEARRLLLQDAAKLTWEKVEDGREHGINKTYQAGCRCHECKKAHARMMKQWRKPTVRKEVSRRDDRAERMMQLVDALMKRRAA